MACVLGILHMVFEGEKNVYTRECLVSLEHGPSFCP